MRTFSTIHDLRQALSDHMRSRGLTQQDVAKDTGIAQSAISLFLRNKRGLNAESVLRIIRILPEQSRAERAPQEAQDA